MLQCYDEHGRYLVAKQFYIEQNALPVKIRYRYTSFNQLFTSLFDGSLLLFEKNLDYLSLSAHDRSLLLHEKLQFIGGFSTCFLLNRLELHEDPAFFTAAETIYGSQSMSAVKVASNLIDSDGTFIKLAIAIFIFSTFGYTVYTNRPPTNLENVKAVIRIQEKYIDLTWKYLVYKHGYNRAVISFSNFIRFVFSKIEAIITERERKRDIDMSDIAFKQTENSVFVNY